MSEQKDQVILCPKSLYRLLTGNIIKNVAIILPGMKKSGMTLIPFWRERLLPLMPAQVMNDMFNTDEKRNRKLSNLMNRTGESPMPADIKAAFGVLLSTDGLLKIISGWMDFLLKNDCNTFSLARSISLFEDRCFTYDPVIPASVRTHLLNLQRETPENERKGGVSFIFEQAVHLSWLMLYAFHGRYMSLDVFRRLRTDPANTTNALWNMYTNITFGRRVPIVLTTRECIICRQGLSRDAYLTPGSDPVGALIELLDKQGKAIITGMGGIGKTELVRQAMQVIENTNRYARLAFVQYEDSLCVSFRRSFAELAELESEQIIPQARRLLEQQGLGKTLLVIDNMDISDRNDPDVFALPSYGCDIIITSRLSGLDGFATLPLGPMADEDAKKLLEIVAPGIRDESEREKKRLLKRVHGHPLSITLMGRLYTNSHIPLKELNDKLALNGFEGLELNRYGQTVSILEMLRNTFGVAFRDNRNDQLLVLFSALHYGDYSVEQLSRVLRDAGDSPDALSTRMHTLSEFGWLEESNTGFAMHPVIAELFRPRVGELDSYPHLKKILLDIAEQDPLSYSILPGDFFSVLELFASIPDRSCEELLSLFPPLLSLLQAFPRENSLFERLLEKYKRMTVDRGPTDTHYWCYKVFEGYTASLESGIASLAGVIDEIIRNRDTVPPEALAAAATFGLQTGVFILDPKAWERFYDSFRDKAAGLRAGIALESIAAQVALAILNNPEKAEEHLNAAREIIRQRGLEGSAYEIDIMAITGELFRNRGAYEQAAEMLEKAISAEYKRTHGAVSENVISMVLGLGDVYLTLGDPDKALDNLHFATDNVSRISGEYSRNTLICMNNICPVYMKLNQPERALEINSQVIERNEKVRVFSDAETANLYRNQATYYMRLDRCRDADYNILRARGIYAAALGEDNIRVSDCDVMHAFNLAHLGNTRKARALLKQTEPKIRAYYSPDAIMIETLNVAMAEAFPDYVPPD